MNRYIDTHTHLFVEEFDIDREETLQRAIEAGVTKLCLPCITSASIAPIKELCANHPGICFPMAGLHPTELGDDYKTELEKIKKELDENPDIIAVGEVGIDLYWDTTRRKEQIEVFETQVAWAREKNLPLSIHTRNAFEELFDSLENCKAKELQGIFHCFSGGPEEANKLLPYEGFLFGIGGVVTYKKSTLPDTLNKIPLERIVLETDAPYLAPVPRRGKRNESSYLPFIAERLAEIYDTTAEEVARITTSNAEKLFGI